MLSLYSRVLESYPVRTEMVTSALLWFAGDVLAQKLEMRSQKHKTTTTTTPLSAVRSKTKGDGKEATAVAAPSAPPGGLDWKRTSIQTAYAALLWAPLGHHWYNFLDRTTLRFARAGTRTFVAAKLALEIVALHPLALLAFFGCVGAMSGETFREIGAQLRRDYGPTLAIEYVMWTPLDILNFALVPVRHQLLVVNVGCLFESVLLSFVKANGLRLPGHGTKEGSAAALASADKKTD